MSEPDDRVPADDLIEAEVVREDDAPETPISGQNLPAVRASEAIMARGELSVEEIVAQKDKIVQIMQKVMVEDVHYGKIPGVSKPSLLKPGAEAINVALRLAPIPHSERVFDGDHLTVFATVTLQHIPTGLVIAAGEGMCSSREEKYAYRKAKRKCPECGQEAIIKGKAEYGGGWVCWKKAGKSDGCGAKFPDGDERIESQEEGTVPNEHLPDTWNTVLKMADKRALIAAVLNGTAASDVFTQDMEDSKVAAEGSADEHGSGTRARQQTRRQEGPEPYPIPKSWPEIEKAVRACDNTEEAWALFEAFRRACSYHLFGVAVSDPDDDAGLLKPQQWATLGQKAAGAAVWLHEHPKYEMGELVFFDETQQRQAWAAVLEGALLEIPDYVAPLIEEAREAAEADEERARLAEGAEGS